MILCMLSLGMSFAHSAHCRACKERIRELLAVLYGECRVNHSFSWSAQPQDYKNSPIENLLQQIHVALGNLRGHRDFIKAAQVPPCDFYISNPPFILEFDESQHFSRPRLVTLTLYPEDLKLGFSVTRWKELCRDLDAQDETPIDRDERRAWYDTLRDLVPAVYGFQPTVRLYAAEYPWCALKIGSGQDQERFRGLFENRFLPGNRQKNK